MSTSGYTFRAHIAFLISRLMFTCKLQQFRNGQITDLFLTAHGEDMNISSQISSTHAANSSLYVSSNVTVEESHFDMFKVIDVISVMLGLPINSYVIWLIVTGTGNGLAAEFFLLNFSVCEILLCLEILLTVLGDTIYILFTIVIFVEGLPITGCPLFQCVICVERYLAVVYPVTFLQYKPLRYRVICAIVVWMATFVSNGVTIAFFLLTLHLNVYFGFILAQFLIFLSIQLFCCLAVLRALKQSGPGGREREEENHMKKRAFHLILITAVIMFFTYMPFIISMLFFCLICVERYLAVMYPVTFLKFKPLRYKVACAVVVWVISMYKANQAEHLLILVYSKVKVTMNISMETVTLLTEDFCNTTIVYQYKLLAFDIALHVFNVLFGLPTHFYILWLIVTRKTITSEFFALNISVCEIMFCLRSGTVVIATEFPTLRDMIMFLSGFAITGRFFQCLICIERYLAVVHPVTYLKYKALRYRVACCTIIWIMILIFCIVYMQLVSLCFFRLYKFLYVSQCLVFLSISLFCCLAVLRALKQSGPGEREGEREREEENHMKRRAFNIILITTVTLLITYVPSLIVSFEIILSIPPLSVLDSMSRACYVLASFVQPLLYIHRVGKLPVCKIQ
ncbi:hypothetical protein E1301_Tti011759 [Triplophysa tibetana]|uniref:G-protein coupled receptors family 1 profile domain-containing protein n=1 Tax=Triplophysa tibetana TaxID=1572043 RepID=A0A5A9PBK4_9TELE|nr:hypothetical protein E1301_Tti011759 [Triplophysa tibetana]